MSLSPLEFVIRGVLVYVFILFLLRVNGKRQMGQMSATEFVAILLISNAVQNSMNGGDNSLSGGIILAVALIVLSRLISVASYKSVRMKHLFQGMPTILIHKGATLDKNLEKERITRNEIKTLLRKQGVHSLHDVHTAILETDGSVTVFKNEDIVSSPSI